jgi:transposase-like protein
MYRKTSHDRRYKKSIWTQEQKLQAVSTYLMLGNMSETALITGVSLNTLKMWKNTDWFKEYALQLQTEDVQQMSSTLRKVIDKALKAVENRLDVGDAQFDQKTGDIIRIPIKAHVALKITTDLMTKQQKLYENPAKEQVEKTIDARLLKLSEEFARFATAKRNTIDIEAIEIKQNVEA